MKRKKFKLRAGLLLAFLVLSLGIGGSYAYYSAVSDARNQVITKGSEVFLQEVFNKDDQWLPGETKKKAVHFGNQGGRDQVIRFQVIEAWYDNKGTPGNLADDVLWNYTGSYSPKPAQINWTSEVTGGTVWKKIGNWYYYTKVLKAASAGSTVYTPDVISGVTFSPALSNAGPGAREDFSNKRYSLTIQMESLDVNTDITKEAWKMTFTQAGGALTWSTTP